MGSVHPVLARYIWLKCCLYLGLCTSEKINSHEVPCCLATPFHSLSMPSALTPFTRLGSSWHCYPSIYQRQTLVSAVTQLTAQALELEDLPEDDDEDIDFTLEGLLGPLESDLEDDVAEMAAAVAEAPHTRGKAAAKRPMRHAGSQDPSRCVPCCAWSLHTKPQCLHALLHFIAFLLTGIRGMCNPHSVRNCFLCTLHVQYDRSCAGMG